MAVVADDLPVSDWIRRSSIILIAPPFPYYHSTEGMDQTAASFRAYEVIGQPDMMPRHTKPILLSRLTVITL